MVWTQITKDSVYAHYDYQSVKQFEPRMSVLIWAQNCLHLGYQQMTKVALARKDLTLSLQRLVCRASHFFCRLLLLST